MAEATTTTRMVEKVIQAEEKVVTLTLTGAEATFISSLAYFHESSDEDASDAGFAIRDALAAAGVSRDRSLEVDAGKNVSCDTFYTKRVPA